MKILIAGLPKSGTTALFSQVARSVPGPHLALFEPPDGMAVYQREDLKHVDLDQVTLVAKILCTPPGVEQDHLCRLPDVDYDSFEHYTHKLFLVRDPRDNLISFMLYMIVNTTRLIQPAAAREFIQQLECKERSPQQVSLADLLETMGRLNDCDFLDVFLRWQQFSVEFTQQQSGWKLVRYERVVAGAVEDIEQHLGFKLTAPQELPKQWGRVARTKSSGDWQNWFNAVDVNVLRPHLDPLLVRRDYALDWSLPETVELRPHFGSEYVRRIVNELYASEGLSVRL